VDSIRLTSLHRTIISSGSFKGSAAAEIEEEAKPKAKGSDLMKSPERSVNLESWAGPSDGLSNLRAYPHYAPTVLVGRKWHVGLEAAVGASHGPHERGV
jgi:hypothetical protein